MLLIATTPLVADSPPLAGTWLKFEIVAAWAGAARPNAAAVATAAINACNCFIDSLLGGPPGSLPEAVS
ncbi:MAG: hypothetical protein U0800_16995 [Isosphaeraceae bacterium]